MYCDSFNLWRNRATSLARRRMFHHLFPLVAFLFLALILLGVNHRKHVSQHTGDPNSLTFRDTFLRGRWDMGYYRGIGTSLYLGKDNKRAGWYPGAAIAGGILWRLAGMPVEKGFGGTLFYLGFFVPAVLAGAGFFYCFHRYALVTWGASTAVLSTLSLASFPPSFYFLTAFPYNYALLAMTVYLLIYRSSVRGREVYLGLTAWFCSITYPTAVLFAVYPLCAEARRQLTAGQFSWREYIVYGLPFALGPLSFFTYLYFATGDFLGYLHVQEKLFARSPGNPLRVILASWSGNSVTAPENLVALLIILYLALFGTVRLGFPLWAYLCAVLILSPAAGSFQSIYRYYLMAFPLHYLVGLSPKHPSLKLLAAGLCAYLGIKYYFVPYILNALI